MKAKIIFTILALGSTFIFAQKQQVKVADKFFKNYAYVKASEFYEDAIKRGDSSAHVLTRLGDCYYNNSDSENSAIWYGEAVSKYEDKLDAEYIYKYSQSLRGQGNYEEAIVWLEKFKALSTGDDSSANLDYANLDLYNKLSSTDDVYVKVNSLSINSKNSDFGAFEHNGKLIFSSARNGNENLYDWNEEPYLDLYEAEIIEKDGKRTLGAAKKFKGEGINTEYHEANVAISNDGNTLYFTRDNVNKRNRLKTDKEGTAHLKIYKASFVDSVWQDIVELPFNDKLYSSGHPALSPDGNTLFFVSDREGGFGQTDIYKVDITEDTYGEPENLGPTINTVGKEMFPFVAKDSTLYFSSDSYINLGFLDIYKSNIIKDSSAKVENLGAPYNSGSDDFAFSINVEEERGYFSSNRASAEGSDDVFGFVQCSQYIKGFARNSRTLEILPMTTVQLINEDGKIIDEVTTDEEGAYSFKVKCNTKYTILGRKIDYKDDVHEITTTEIFGHEVEQDLLLIPLIIDNEIVINPIFFDFDKWEIRADAAYELENIVGVMRDHPEMVIKIEAHTDSRGRDNYNMKLSDRRAKSTRDYLLSREIATERIESAIGYGETQLVNECANRVKCSKEKHQENRRSKFIIIKDNN